MKLTKGPNFCKLRKKDFDQARENNINHIENCISARSQTHVTDVVLLQWKNQLMNLANKQITTLIMQTSNNNLIETSS